MKKVITACLVLAVLAGCRGEVPASAPQVAQSGFDQMVAGLGNRFIWNCRMQSNRGAPDWRFVLRRGKSGDALDVDVLEAGTNRVRQIDNLRTDDAARLYFLQDGGIILVASDGEARGRGESGSKGAEYNSGRCERGAQPT